MTIRLLQLGWNEGVRMRVWKSVVVFTITALVVITAHSEVHAAQELKPYGALNAHSSPVPGFVHKTGLWDKPNEACTQKCEVFVSKNCFRDLAAKNPGADPGSIQDQCDDKFSVCLYDCMCDTCDENQIIIKQP